MTISPVLTVTRCDYVYLLMDNVIRIFSLATGVCACVHSSAVGWVFVVLTRHVMACRQGGDGSSRAPASRRNRRVAG